MASRWSWLMVLLALVVAGTTGCEGSDENGNQGGSAAGDGEGADDGFTGSGGFGMGLQIDPPEATIIVDNGVSSPVQLKAYRNGEEVDPDSWMVDFGTIADVDAHGLVTATDAKGGLVTVTAEWEGITGTAQISVLFKKTLNPGNVSDADQDTLRAATAPDAAITWAYPYDKTVWPQKLLAPEMMWNGGGTGDLYYLHFVGEYVDVEVFTGADPPSRYQIEQAEWVAINESGSGASGDVDVRVHRLAAGGQAAFIAADHDWKMSRGSLKGTVYYWANNLGRIIRIKPGQEIPDDFLADSGAVSGNDCTACHVVSANGATLAIGGDVGWNNYDLLSDSVVFGLGSVGKQVRNWAMPALSPDGRFIVENNAPLPGPPGGADGLWDAATGVKLVGTGLDGAFLNMPAFSPLGHMLSYVENGGAHDLGVYDFSLTTGQASNPHTLIAAGSDPNMNAICFPNMSPTVKKGEGNGQTYIVYHRGHYPNSLDTRTGNGYLYMASADTAGQEWRLAAANGDTYPFAAGDRDRGNNYEPTFAPQPSGGYLWVVFTSRRTYGNRLNGAQTEVKQLWVAAINPFPVAGEDPSHPAFFVRGQDMASLNMRGYWALDPCVQTNGTCTTDDDCCDGRKCEDGVCGGADECVPVGGECVEDSDCCDSPEVSCLAGICGTEGPQ